MNLIEGGQASFSVTTGRRQSCLPVSVLTLIAGQRYVGFDNGQLDGDLLSGGSRTDYGKQVNCSRETQERYESRTHCRKQFETCQATLLRFNGRAVGRLLQLRQRH
jgi:hypothetical protein